MRATARFGFMEKPDISALLAEVCLQNRSPKLGHVRCFKDTIG
jgi:hypothetical protein